MNEISKNYKTLIFDCDGVILESNEIKSLAFFESVKKFGLHKANALKNYHIQNGGISRQEKFSYFLKNIHQTTNYEKDLKMLTEAYGRIVFQHLLECNVNRDIFDLSEKVSDHKRLVISGGNEEELRLIFELKKIDKFFTEGIYGNPLSKIEIFSKLLKDGVIEKPAIYIGDSKYDWEAATQFGIDFLFYTPWTEFKLWKDFCAANEIYYFEHFSDLGKYISFENHS